MKKHIVSFFILGCLSMALVACGTITTDKKDDMVTEEIATNVSASTEERKSDFLFFEESFQSLEYTGSGDTVLNNIEIPEGVFVATVETNSKEHTDVWFHLNDENKILLANNSEPFKVTVLLKEESRQAVDDGIFEITCADDWKITVDKLSEKCSKQILGSGNVITGLIEGTGSNETLSISMEGENVNHSVWIYEYNTDYEILNRELLVNSCDGDYSGDNLVKLEKEKKYFFAITNGIGCKWSINFKDNTDDVSIYYDTNEGENNSSRLGNNEKNDKFVAQGKVDY